MSERDTEREEDRGRETGGNKDNETVKETKGITRSLFERYIHEVVMHVSSPRPVCSSYAHHEDRK